MLFCHLKNSYHIPQKHSAIIRITSVFFGYYDCSLEKCIYLCNGIIAKTLEVRKPSQRI